jgi:hypothetical protein
MDVVKCKELTTQEKIDILHEWQIEARELEVADEENMCGPQDDDKLSEILLALHELNESIDVQHGAPTKHGGTHHLHH